MSLQNHVGKLLDRIVELEKTIKSILPRIHEAPLHAGKAKELTISVGAITVTRPHILLQPETGLTDDLNVINGGQDGKFVILAVADAGDTVTVNDQTVSAGNIDLHGTNWILDNVNASIFLYYLESTGRWHLAGIPKLGDLRNVDVEGAATDDLIHLNVAGTWVNVAPSGISGTIPAAHAASHQHSGSDEVSTATPTANAIVKASAAGKIDNNWLDAELIALAGVTSAVDTLFYFTGLGTGSLTALTAFARGFLDDADIATAQATLALTPGTNVQAFDATLLSIAALGTVADRIAYTTAIDVWAETPLTSFARTILDDADQAAVRVTLALVPGTNVQAFDATLLSIAALGTVADRIAYTTALDTWAETPLTAFARTILDDADATAGRATLVLGTIATEAETNYALLAGRAAGQTLKGGTGASETLTLESTAHATKGAVIINPTSGHVGIGTTTPGVDIVGTFDYGSTFDVLDLRGERARIIVVGSTDAGLDLVDSGAAVNAKWSQLLNSNGLTLIRSLTDAGAEQVANIFVIDNLTGIVTWIAKVAAPIFAASTAAGLRLEDDGGNLGVFVEDGGQVGFGGVTTPEAMVQFGINGLLVDVKNDISDFGTNQSAIWVTNGVAGGLRSSEAKNIVIQARSDAPRDIIFVTGGLERMTIFDTGAVTLAGTLTVTGAIVAPTITNFTNAVHTHLAATGGGVLGYLPNIVNSDLAGTVTGTGRVLFQTPLTLDQSSTTGARPVVVIDQADISEEFIEFVTTIGTGNSLEAVGAKTLTTTHFIKVKLPGGLIRYIPCGTIA